MKVTEVSHDDGSGRFKIGLSMKAVDQVSLRVPARRLIQYSFSAYLCDGANKLRSA